ncbi:MAG: ketopantoate reductase family protein [Methanosphaera sp.]|nr:ketopantoate reductase family protein [Methanosphaera sp.]
MNILVIGSGAIGIALGTSLISEGANVSFYATKNTAKSMSNGIRRTGIFKHISVNSSDYTVFTSYMDIPRGFYDYIFICTKTIINEEVSKKLYENRDILKEDTKIIIFQNGYGNDEAYLKYFSKDRVYCARVITGFKRVEPNISQITVHTAPILLGSLQGKDPSVLQPVADMINNSGIPSDTTRELPKYLWAKMLYNCTLNPLGAILNVKYGKLTENQYTIEIMDKLIDEIFNVITTAGFSVDWSSADEYRDEFYSKLVPDTYEHVSSTLQDIQKKHNTEIDSLNGKVISIGEEYNVDVTTNKIIYDMIKAIESQF